MIRSPSPTAKELSRCRRSEFDVAVIHSTAAIARYRAVPRIDPYFDDLYCYGRRARRFMSSRRSSTL